MSHTDTVTETCDLCGPIAECWYADLGYIGCKVCDDHHRAPACSHDGA